MKKLTLLIIILFSISFSFAQEQEKLSEKEKARRQHNIDIGNPFARFGYKPKIATLSKGKYLEFHDRDSIVKIGSFTYNTRQKKVTGFTDLDTVYSEATLRPELISRWFNPDPLSDEFPSWSPYNFVKNNPVRFVDPDGRAPEDWIKDRYGGYLWDDNATSQSTTRAGWDYVGKTLPSGVDRYNILTEVNGGLYHKNTNNVFASAGNSINSLFGGDSDYFVNHKSYDPVGENNLREGINTGVSIIVSDLAFKGISKGASALMSRSTQSTVANTTSKALAPFYPINNGAMGEVSNITLKIGEQIDRFGKSSGRFFSPKNTPLLKRALPPGTNTALYNSYQVVKPFSVEASTIAPAFGKVGTGTQYFSKFLNAKELVKGGYLKPIK